MNEDIKPALTAEEWKQRSYRALGREDTNGVLIGFDARLTDDGREFIAENVRRDPDGAEYQADDDFEVRAVGQERHALAALAGHGQPWWFTREDVRALRDDALFAMIEGHADKHDRLLNLAARLASLLPPEEP
jgi:hypothetical protein